MYSVIRRNDKKYVKLIDGHRKRKKPVALLFFKFDEYLDKKGEEIIDEVRQKICFRLMDLMNHYVRRTSVINYSSTFIPYYDIIYENLFKKNKLSKKPSDMPSDKPNDKPIDKRRQLKKFNVLFGLKIPIDDEINEDDQPDNISMVNYNPNSFFLKPKEIKIVERKKINVEIDGASKIIDKNKFAQIMRYIPAIFQLSKWELVYSPVVHGTSIKLFYRKMFDKGPTLSSSRTSMDISSGPTARTAGRSST